MPSVLLAVSIEALKSSRTLTYIRGTNAKAIITNGISMSEPIMRDRNLVQVEGARSVGERYDWYASLL